jgi:hypothetical protein
LVNFEILEDSAIRLQDRKTARPQDRKTARPQDNIMEYFLQRIAKFLYSENGDNLRDHCLVFPGRRPGLFFLKYLSAEIDRPVWMPSVLTINDLFRSLSKLHQAENEILLFELYKVFRNISRSGESFDDFYFWGDMLLNDFDDTDKYLADASILFRNVSDLKEIDQKFGGLSQEQIEVVRRFWTNFDPVQSTEAKEKFINIWSILGALYNDYNKILRNKNLAYEGMIFREVAENPESLRSPGFRWKTVHFIGFNALNECEKRLMLRLKESARASFYWDFDSSYIEEGGMNSAGFFLRNNLKVFGNDMPDDWNYNTLLSSDTVKVRRRVIETSSDIAQVKMIPDLISEIPGLTPENAHDTAVVLADENLLVPVLSSLPANIPDIYITMGYPLKQTSAYSLVRQLLDLQRSAKEKNGAALFGYEEVTKLLKNELVSGMLNDEERKIPEQIIKNNLLMIPAERFRESAMLSQIFVRHLSPAGISDYIKRILLMVVNEEPEKTSAGSMPRIIINEFIYRIILAVNRLETIIKSPEIVLTTDTWTRLLDRILRMQTVPFSGEPLSGIQIMGFLETRALDFRNLIILSMNEGIMPAVTAASSFIPFSLRQAFGLPSVNHQESVYAYHFYRLLHRSENITFVFNSNPEGLRSGEMSRFLQQMKYEPSEGPESLNLSFEIRNPVAIGNTIQRTADHNQRLFSRFPPGNSDRPFSPSALNIWLNCRMKFYYQFINSLSEPKKVITEIDPARLGSMVHSAIRSLYGNFIGKTVDREIISGFIEDQQALAALVSRSVNEVLKREEESFTVINEMMVREVLHNYVLRILETDKAAAPFKIFSIEKPYTFRLTFETDSGHHEVMAGGNIDRVDIKDGIMRIVDYKTGITSDSVASISDLFKDDRDKDPDAWLQTLFYCEACLSQVPDAVVRPSVYKLKLVPGEKVSDKLISGDEIVEKYSQVRNGFLENLHSTVSQIFSSREPFIMTTKQSAKCRYCPFSVLCGR